MLEDMKTLLGITEEDTTKDDLLELLIKQASNFAKLYTGLESSTPALKTCIVKMAIIDYNRLGTEGLESESYSGTSYNYSATYPDTVLAMLDKIKSQGKGRIGIFW